MVCVKYGSNFSGHKRSILLISQCLTRYSVPLEKSDYPSISVSIFLSIYQIGQQFKKILLLLALP